MSGEKWFGVRYYSANETTFSLQAGGCRTAEVLTEIGICCLF